MTTNIPVEKSSLHCKTSISLSKPKRLQLQWWNLKHIEGYLVKKLTVLSSVLFLSSKVLIFIRTLITHFKKELAGVAGWGTQFCFIPQLQGIDIYSHTDYSF